jgi:K+-sensing histidine kinase KdpD
MVKETRASHASIDYELLSHIAHEARGPFNGLIGFSDLLDTAFDSLPVDRQKEYIHLVKLLASKSFFQLQSVIAWLKLVSSNFVLHPTHFYLSEAMKTTIQYMANDLRSRAVVLSLPTERSGLVAGDINYISIALSSILAVILPHLDKQVELSIQTEDTETGTNLQFLFPVAHRHEELVSLFELLSKDSRLISESNTSAWIAGQILHLHQAMITLKSESGDRFNLSVFFPKSV